jgi:hypothetical protein
MTTEETEILRLLAAVLSSPRDRLGRLQCYSIDSERLRKLVLGMRAPDGGLDTVDQVRMVLQGLAGDEITSSTFPKARVSP